MVDITPTYRLAPEAVTRTLHTLTRDVAQALSCDITHTEAIEQGQNLNYRLTTTHPQYPYLLLRIWSRKGYPSYTTLQECYAHLHRIGLDSLEILYANTTSPSVPYGYFVQPWVVGTCAADVHQDPVQNMMWLEDSLAVLRRVHTITLPYFGCLGEGPQYPDIQTYFDHVDTMVDHSFGQVTPADFSIWELDEFGITSPSFLTATCDTVSEWARRIVSPVQAVLVHGDMFPTNLVYTETGGVLIDWDETRANWWVYEVARTLFYYPNRALLEHAIACYQDDAVSLAEIETGIQLEHVRQYLRHICMAAFGTPTLETMKHKVKHIEAQITSILQHI